MEKRRILLVEDDPAIALGLVDALDFEGFAVVHAKTGQEGVNSIRAQAADCVVLDLMLPDMNGYRVCETIRETHPNTPILMLSARGQETDKIRGLDVGADDYVTKPFSIGELIARIRALLRRTERAGSATLRIGDNVVDADAQVLERDGERHALSFYEVQVLRCLYARAGQVVNRDELMERVWGSVAAAPNNRTVDNFIVKLRKKIEPQPDRPIHILTIYGLGYKLVV